MQIEDYGRIFVFPKEVSMIRSQIIEVVLDQHVSRVTVDFVPRYHMFRHLDSPNLITIITGIRRCGKSTLLNEIRHIKEVHDYYLNFDDDRLLNFNLSDFQVLFEIFIEKFGNQNTFYFDEIQNINGWERFVRRLHDLGKKIYITGSNAKMLSRELGTHLTGRYMQIELYPFSLAEYAVSQNTPYEADFASTTIGKATWMGIFNQFIEVGGIPEYIKTKNRDYLKSLYEGILYKDILTRHNLTKEKEIKELLYIIAGNVSKEISQNGLAKTIGIKNSSTIKEYLQYFEDSYLAFTLLKFDDSLKRQILAPRKVYFIDTALAKNISFRRSEDFGRILENIIYLELKRRGGDIFYFKGQQECDFINLKQDGTSLYQVCYDLTDETTKKREIGGLLEAMMFFKLDFGYILTMAEENIIKIDAKTISIIPAWKWMVGLR